jgi:ATP-dependent helicase HrpA
MIQHKGLRVDLVEDEEWLYAFYDHKLPPEIVSGVTLDTWRKKVERENKQFLFFDQRRFNPRKRRRIRQRVGFS